MHLAGEHGIVITIPISIKLKHNTDPVFRLLAEAEVSNATQGLDLMAGAQLGK
jgi:hypothetical protein